MTSLEIELAEMEERLAKLRARARVEAAIAAPPKGGSTALSRNGQGATRSRYRKLQRSSG
jgi:hypothetical protein